MRQSNKENKEEAKPLLAENILTAGEVAAYLRLTVSTVCKLAASGELPGFKIGKSWRFDRDEVMKRIDAAKKNKQNTV
ncbi:MAG: Helix-turn-helix domain protein [Syntrophus sp. PtaB.Bin001]|jgi:excisionase family DNA binding protein|nr:MAG: Helix-turn-helix domain protein [Syntrophus sp. PtaB.Bin001]